MDPKEELAQLQAEATTLKAKGDALTPADIARVPVLTKRMAEVQHIVDRRENASKALASVNVITSGGGDGMDDGYPSGPWAAKSRGGDPRAARVAGFSAAFKRAFEDAAPMVGGFGARKALVPSGSVSVDYAGPILEAPAAQPGDLSGLVQHTPVDGPSGAYLQQTARVNAAATVATGQLKPTSEYTLEWAQWKLATIAHLAGPYPKQWLADFAGLAEFLSAEMALGVAQAVDTFVLSGGTAEDGSTVTGLLNSGIENVPFTTDALLSLRQAVGVLQTGGIESTGIVLNAADWQAIETLKDTTGRYLLPLAPQASVARSLWGVPVVLAAGVPAGQGIVGDFRYVNVLNKGNYEISWMENTTHEDNATLTSNYERNMIGFRAEGRYGLNITSKAALRTVALVKP